MLVGCEVRGDRLQPTRLLDAAALITSAATRRSADPDFRINVSKRYRVNAVSAPVKEGFRMDEPYFRNVLQHLDFT